MVRSGNSADCSGIFTTRLMRLGLIMCVILLAQFASSCQPRDRDASGNSVRVKGSGSLRKQQLTRIRFRPQWLHQAQFAGVYMALERGFYRNYGLDVQLQSGGPDFPAYESLVQGKSDIVTLFLSSALNHHSSEQPLVNLAQVSQRSAIMLVGKRSPSLNSVEDLNGKMIGLWRNDFREPSLIYFREKGLNVEAVPIDWSVNLLLNNAIDMMNVMLYNEYHQVLMAGLNREELFEIRLSEQGYNLLEDGLYTTAEYYQNNREACDHFAEATMDGWIYALNHTEETLDVVVRLMRQDHIAANRPHQAWMLDKMKELVLADPESIGRLKPEDFEFAQNLLFKHQLLEQKIDYRSFYPHGIQDSD